MYSEIRYREILVTLSGPASRITENLHAMIVTSLMYLPIVTQHIALNPALAAVSIVTSGSWAESQVAFLILWLMV